MAGSFCHNGVAVFLPAAIPLNDGCLKGNTFKAWYMECDVSRSGGEVPVVVAAAVAPTGLAALIADCLGQLLGLLLQQFIQRFFPAAANQFFQLPLDCFLIKLYNLLGHSLLSPFRMLCGDFILPESANYVSFLLFSFAQLIGPVDKSKKTAETHRGPSRTINWEIAKDGIYHPLEV